MEYENEKPEKDDDIKKIIEESKNDNGDKIPRGEFQQQGTTNGSRMPESMGF